MKSLTERLGVVIGKGPLAFRVAEIVSQKYDCAICFLDKDNFKRFRNKKTFSFYKFFPLTQISEILRFFDDLRVKKICMIGGLGRPSIGQLIFSDKEFKDIFEIIRGSGDTNTGRVVIKFLEDRGFQVFSCHEIVPEIVVSEGLYSGDLEKIKLECFTGFLFLTVADVFDFCQAVVVRKGQILAAEDFLGTDDLIERAYRTNLNEMVLVKSSKLSQDTRFDLPAIGEFTVNLLKKRNFIGLIVEAGKTLCHDLPQVIRFCQENNLIFASVSREFALGLCDYKSTELQKLLSVLDQKAPI
ncbi:MAG: UDP-2,3-diacylglucosamine diphosphatase LpxI [Deltaproteobacteria bacterium]|nr:UDP-2,3-diacylglucosamine diphosphatase LpxI [Deltaproteobacteria bacterium]